MDCLCLNRLTDHLIRERPFDLYGIMGGVVVVGGGGGGGGGWKIFFEKKKKKEKRKMQDRILSEKKNPGQGNFYCIYCVIY